MADADVIRATVEELRARFGYNPITGNLWNKFREGNRLPGRVYNPLTPLVVLGQRVKKYRLIWKLHYGVEPPPLIDHKDGNRRHNWIDNLRDATKAQNAYNTSVRSDSVTGVKGVFYKPKRKSKPYHVAVKTPTGKKHIGYYATVEEASAAYQSATEFQGEFRRAA